MSYWEGDEIPGAPRGKKGPGCQTRIFSALIRAVFLVVLVLYIF